VPALPNPARRPFERTRAVPQFQTQTTQILDQRHRTLPRIINLLPHCTHTHTHILAVPAPSAPELSTFLMNVAKKHNQKVDSAKIKQIAECRDIRLSLLLLQKTDDSKTDWEQKIEELVQDLAANPSTAVLDGCRSRCVELLQQHVPPASILDKISQYIYSHVPSHLHHTICAAVADCDLRLAAGTKPIFHLDLLLAQLALALAPAPTTHSADKVDVR